jgi:hypothetical protein
MLTFFSRQIGRRSTQSARRFFSSSAAGSRAAVGASQVAAGATTAALALTAIATYAGDEKFAALAARIPTSGDVLSVGTPVKEKATGISFPQLCNGFQLVGTGVRIKYVFVKGKDYRDDQFCTFAY